MLGKIVLMNELKLTSPIPVSLNHYKGMRTFIKNGKPMTTVYVKKEAVEYKENFKQYLTEQVKLQNWNIEVNDTQHFYVDAVFYFDRVDKDADDYSKILLDAITETQLIWKDDNTALFRPHRIYYDNQNPRLELHIYPVDYIGIFDNQTQLENFENNCQKCSRYRNQCQILKKAKEGRVQKEITDLECSKYKEKKEK